MSWRGCPKTYAENCSPETYARRSGVRPQLESDVNPFGTAGRAQPPALVIGHPFENPFPAARAARDGQV